MTDITQQLIRLATWIEATERDEHMMAELLREAGREIETLRARERRQWRRRHEERP